MFFIENWYKLLTQDNKKISFVDAETIYTRADVELLSGKIYELLKIRGIGIGDFVTIDLPRTSKMFIAMLGINKAGAAFVAMENDYAKERKGFIISDTKSTFVLNEETFKECMACEYRSGYEKISNHDIAYAIYTSGTTGNPKGIVHEFGNYAMLKHSISDPVTGDLRETEDTRFLNIAPFNFVASVMIYVLAFYSGGTVYTPDYDIIKNIRKLIEYMHANKITETFIAPSLLKIIGSKLNPEIKVVYTGSEHAGGVSIPKGELYNLYLMSETGFVLCQYKIEKSEDMVPVGKPNEGIEIKLNDNDEILVKNEYCRGYIHESNNDVFSDGYYNTRDIAELDSEGNYVLKGRSEDMIKINGNRVEPLEVEITAKRVVKEVINCAVKGFTRNHHSFLCMYYESNEELNEHEMSEKLEEYLPYYMIPAHFIKVESLPRTRLGKIDKKVLKEPEKSLRIEYVAPRSDAEVKMCKVFEKVLSLDRIGIKDDLLECGLTSLQAIEAITDLDYDEIVVNDIYKSRTIERLAIQYEKTKAEFLTEQEREIEGRKVLYPLHEESAFFYFLQSQTNFTAINLSTAWKLNRLVNVEKLRNAINCCMEDSSMFKMNLVLNEAGVPLQQYNPDIYKPVEIEYMSEDEVEYVRKNFVRPFNMISEPLYRIRLIKTKKYTYLFIDMHHLITDAMGLAEFVKNIVNSYQKKPLKTFNYFAYCYDKEKRVKSEEYKNGIKKIEKRLTKLKLSDDIQRNEDLAENYSVTIEYNTGIAIKKLNHKLEEACITRNILFFTTLNLILAKRNKRNDNICSWIYSNRVPNANQAGCLASRLLCCMHLDRKMDIKSLFSYVNDEIRDSISYSYVATEIKVPYQLAMGIDDIGDLQDLGKKMEAVAKPVELEHPYDAVASSSEAYSNLYFLNKDSKLYLRLTTNNSIMNAKERDEFLSSINNVMKRLLDGDESVIAEYIN